MKVAVTVLATLLFAACAAEPPAYKPYPRPAITKEQWVAYHDAVIKAYGATRRVFPDKHLETFGTSDRRTHFAFTTEGHPAHPAWVMRTNFEKDGRFFLNQIGYFAGNEDAFAAMFRAYQALTESTVQKTYPSATK